MKIGIVGSGNIGGTAARLFVKAGHEVAISNSRGPESLQEFVAELGANARAATVEGAARFGEIVLVAVPLKNYADLPADAFRGKIVIDANNYYPARDGHIEALDRDEVASSELLARHLDGARVVKAFNTIWSEHLKVQGDRAKPVDARRVIPISGDDADAKHVVASLIEDIGFGPLDLGSLAESRKQQVGTKIYNNDITVQAARAL
jgi:predicted dinucleotide-binding enzyme